MSIPSHVLHRTRSTAHVRRDLSGFFASATRASNPAGGRTPGRPLARPIVRPTACTEDMRDDRHSRHGAGGQTSAEKESRIDVAHCPVDLRGNNDEGRVRESRHRPANRQTMGAPGRRRRLVAAPSRHVAVRGTEGDDDDHHRPSVYPAYSVSVPPHRGQGVSVDVHGIFWHIPDSPELADSAPGESRVTGPWVQALADSIAADGRPCRFRGPGPRQLLPSCFR
jgi:hypothetical protein